MSERTRIALVTGGSGFIGSHLVERLVRDGWRVRVLDARPPAGEWFAALGRDSVEVVVGDIRDLATVERAARETEVVFHQAAIASVQRSIDDPQETVEVNIGGTLNVLEAARKAGSRRVVFASSAAVYGDGPESPKVETLAPRPLSPYAVSKLTGEQLCAVYSHLHGLETVALRYFNVYGPRQDPSSPYSGVISRFVDAIQRGEPVTIYGDGEQTRDFVYVGDVVEANVLAAETADGSGAVFNVGSGVATSLNSLLDALSRQSRRDVTASYAPGRPGDIRESVSNIERATQRLGFQIQTPLSNGLEALMPPDISPGPALGMVTPFDAAGGAIRTEGISHQSANDRPDQSSSRARRAVVCYVENKGHLVQQTLALRRSWLYTRSPDTDLVVMGPEDVLNRLPDDLVKIPQRAATDDPVWSGYGYVNSIASLNAHGAERLDVYSHILRTDVDTFILPGWNTFYPERFIWGTGAYSNSDDIREKLKTIAAEYGLNHRGFTNVGSTWYGPTAQVRRTAAFSEMLSKHILTHYFATDKGAWPDWYAGVTLLYAGEIAVNHCAADGERSEFLDAWSTSDLPVTERPHVHCWHTDAKFSKHWFMSGRYSREVDGQNLDLSIVRDFCMEMSFQSLEDMAALEPAKS